jgi:hypothetical protein
MKENFALENKIIKAISTWYGIKNKSPFKGICLEADLKHSGLFERLMNNKEPLPNPPPLNHSYPWYDLIENGESEILEPFMAPDDDSFFRGHLIIEQHPWKIVKKISDKEWLVPHERTPNEIWKVWMDGKRELPGTKPVFVDNWKIKKESEN